MRAGESQSMLGVLAIGEDARPKDVFVASYPRTVWRSAAACLPGCNATNLLPRLLEFLPDQDEISFFDDERFCLVIFTVRQFCPMRRRRSVRQASKAGTGAEEVAQFKAQFKWVGNEDTWLEIVDKGGECIMGAYVNSQSFVTAMLGQSQNGVEVSDAVGRKAVLRTLHEGMAVGVFDARMRILTEVFHATIGLNTDA